MNTDIFPFNSQRLSLEGKKDFQIVLWKRILKQFRLLILNQSATCQKQFSFGR